MQGDELKQLRSDMGLSQAALATALGMTPTWVGQMERGAQPIEVRTALAVRCLADAHRAEETLAAIDDGMRFYQGRGQAEMQDVTAQRRSRAEAKRAMLAERLGRILDGGRNA